MAIFYTDSGSFNSLQVTGSANITASSGIALRVKSSGSTIFSISGSGGEILNISDLSSTNLFSVSSGSTNIFSVDNTKSVKISGSLIVTGSIIGTSSYATQALSSSFATTASYVLGTVVSASYASTASYVQNAQTASYVTTAQTASYILQAVSSSFATTASYVTLAQTASYVTTAQTASYVLNAVSASQSISSSYSSNALSSSYALTASYVENAQTASYVLNAVSASHALSASYAITSSYLTLLKQQIILSGSFKLDPTQDPDPTGLDLDSTVLFQSSSNTALGYDLYFRQNGNLVKWKWVEGILETGLLYGGVVTYSGSNVFVSPGSGIIADHNATTGSEVSPIIEYVTWNAITQSITNIATQQVTYLYIDNTGALQQQSTRFTSQQYHDYIPLGAVGHFDYTQISAFGGGVQTAYDQISQISNFIDAFGPLKMSGYGLTGQPGSLRLSVESGTSFIHGGFYQNNPEFPSQTTTPFQATASLARVQRSGSAIEFDTNAGNLYTVVDPTKYDRDGDGTLANVGSGNWSIQRVFSDPKTGVLYVYYGQARYTSLLNALQFLPTDPFTEGDTFDFTTFVGFLVLKGNTSDIADTTNNSIINGGLFRGSGQGSGGGIALSNLEDLTDVTITSPINGQALIYDDAIWKNGYPTSASYSQTASYVTLAQTASYVLNTISSSFSSTASYVTTAQTASYVLNTVSASFASTASYVNTLSQNVIITGSLAVGTSSLGASENTITLGARDNASEGGQIGFNAPGGTYTSASFIDNWQNKVRILKGNNTTSTGLIAQWDIHTTQMQLAGYTAASSFPGTATANLAVDSGGNVITVSTSGGTVFPYTGNAVITGSLTTTGIIYAQPNGGMYFQGGDDAALYDINISNHLGVYGVQDSTVGSIKLGSGGGILSGKSGNIGIGTINPTSASLTVNGNVWASSFTGSITGSLTGTATTASYVLNAVSSSYATTASYLNTLNQDLTFNGNLTLNGTASIAYLNVAYESSSIIYSSGSNQFGDATNDTQTLIGRVIVSGSLEVTGSANIPSITGSLLGTASYANQALTASYVQTAQTASYVLQAVSASFATTASYASQALLSTNVVGSANRILFNNGTNTTTTSNELTWTDGTNLLTLGSVAGTAGTISKLALYTSSFGGYGFGVSPSQLDYVTDGSHVFYKNGVTPTELVRITSTGNVGIGTTSPITKLDVASGVNTFRNSAQAFIGLNTDFSNGDYPGIWFNQNTIRTVTNYAFLADGVNTIFNAPTTGTLNFRINNSNKIRVFETGNIVIQNGGLATDAGYRLDVQGTSRFNGDMIVTGSSTATTKFTSPLVESTGTLTLNANGGNIVLKSYGATIFSYNANGFTATPVAATSGFAIPFSITKPNNTNQTATAEIPGWNYIGGSRQWATGNIAIQRENTWGAVTYSFISASMITNAYGNVFNAPIAGPNATIINNYAAQFNGNLQVTGNSIITGSLNVTGGITGSLFGTATTASYVLQAVSSSFATTASYYGGTVETAATASYSTNFTVASTLIIDETLTDYARVTSTIVGANNLFTQATGSYRSAFGKYTLFNGTNARSGEFIAVLNDTNVRYTDSSTTDIGDTTDIVFSAAIVGSDLQINADAASSGWTVRMLTTYL